MNKLFFLGQPDSTLYTPIDKKVKKSKSLRSSRIGSFALKVTSFEALTGFLVVAKKYGLSVAGDFTRATDKKKGSILNIEVGDYITFGISTSFDIDWVTSINKIPKDVPIYNIRSKEAVDAFAEFFVEKNALTLNSKVSGRTYRELKLVELDKKQKEENKKTKKDLTPSDNLPEIITITDQYIKIGYDFITYNPTTDNAQDLIDDFIEILLG